MYCWVVAGAVAPGLSSCVVSPFHVGLILEMSFLKAEPRLLSKDHFINVACFERAAVEIK